jgi:hypothetical protein
MTVQQAAAVVAAQQYLVASVLAEEALRGLPRCVKGPRCPHNVQLLHHVSVVHIKDAANSVRVGTCTTAQVTRPHAAAVTKSVTKPLWKITTSTVSTQGAPVVQARLQFVKATTMPLWQRAQGMQAVGGHCSQVSNCCSSSCSAKHSTVEYNDYPAHMWAADALQLCSYTLLCYVLCSLERVPKVKHSDELCYRSAMLPAQCW